MRFDPLDAERLGLRDGSPVAPLPRLGRRRAKEDRVEAGASRDEVAPQSRACGRASSQEARAYSHASGQPDWWATSSMARPPG